MPIAILLHHIDMNRHKQSPSSSNPSAPLILENDPYDLSIPGMQRMVACREDILNTFPTLDLGDGKQEPLHSSWNLPQPVREDIDRNPDDESMAGGAWQTLRRRAWIHPRLGPA